MPSKNKSHHATNRPPAARDLTVKEQRFIRHYLKTENGTQSAINAGYSEASAATRANELLNREIVKNEIARLKRNIPARTAIDVDQIVFELARLGMSNALDYIDKNGQPITDLRHLSRDAAAAIQDFTVETTDLGDGKKRTRARFKLAPKTQALELLGKHLGMWQQSIRHQVINEMTAAEAEKRLIELESKLIED